MRSCVRPISQMSLQPFDLDCAFELVMTVVRRLVDVLLGSIGG